MKGLIILPDNWVAPNGIVFTPSIKDFAANIYSLAEWNLISDQAIFLPCASIIVNTNDFGGDLQGEEVVDEGLYWLSTIGNVSTSYHISIRIDNKLDLIEAYFWRSDELSVRLVQDIE